LKSTLLQTGGVIVVCWEDKSAAKGETVMGSVIISILKLLISLATLGCAVFIGLQLEPEKEVADRVLLMLGVGLSTFSPLGLVLYVKFWESNPRFSAACGKQAIIGLICFISLSLLSHFFPTAIARW
jgi:hypothetical protein